jgi:aromatic ring-opening dioxygenase catalytic subunit (LigB family)
MRVIFEMSDEDYTALLEACKPTPAMFLSGGTPMFDSPQENANKAWKRLGEKMGFDFQTVDPVQGKDSRWFSAETAPAVEPGQ